MNDKQLLRSLRSIGMGCFAKYFDSFINDKVSDIDLIDAIMKIEGYKEVGARTRVYGARRIINAGLSIDALNLVVSSKRTESWVIAKARFLLEQNVCTCSKLREVTLSEGYSQD